MSIPRDLKVEIPGYGTDKFNAAYTYGGPKLTLQVVKELTGLQINHVVNVDFLGFVRAVDAIGCVYVDVDRRYFHSNAGLPASEQYSEINIQPGYQLLCGKKALAVRALPPHRHRPGPLRPPAGLHQRRPPAGADLEAGPRPERPDRHLHQVHDLRHQRRGDDAAGAETVHRLAQRGDQGGPLPGELGPSYVYASRERDPEAVDKFLGIEASGGPRGSLEDGEAEGGKHGKPPPKHDQAPKPPHREAEAARQRRPGPGRRSRRSSRRRRWPARSARGFPVFYPTRLPSGAGYVESNSYEHVQDPRVYHLKDTDDNRHGAYRMVARAVDLPDGIHYFGVQGIQGWSDPPILDDPSETKTIHGREYDIYVDGDRITMVAWHRGDNTYWVANDLLNTLTNDQMIGIARSANVIFPTRSQSGREAKR